MCADPAWWFLNGSIAGMTEGAKLHLADHIEVFVRQLGHDDACLIALAKGGAMAGFDARWAELEVAGVQTVETRLAAGTA